VSENILPQPQGLHKVADRLPGVVLSSDGQSVGTSSREIISFQGSDVAEVLVTSAAPAPGVFRLSDEQKAALAPPPSNTGAQITLDWLSGTFPLTVTLEEALAFLGQDFAFNGVHYEPSWVPMDRGAMGYKSGLVCGDLKVFHDGTDTMGVHFVLSGKGVKQFMALSNIHTEDHLRAWLTRAEGQGIVFARCDWACDDRSADDPLLDLAVVRAAIDDGLCVSKFKTVEDRRKRGLGKRPGPGAMKEEPLLADVLYFGSIMSEMSVCMYDKAKEQLLPEGQRWIRCELRAKSVRAHLLVLVFIHQGVRAVVDVLRRYLDFKKPDLRKNVTRWFRAKWWVDFLGELCKVEGWAVPKPEPTVERARKWLLNQVAPTFAMLWEAGEQLPFVRLMLELGAPRWSMSQCMAIAAEKMRSVEEGVLIASERGLPCVSP
jgi:phage replication initiation protein